MKTAHCLLIAFSSYGHSFSVRLFEGVDYWVKYTSIQVRT